VKIAQLQNNLQVNHLPDKLSFFGVVCTFLDFADLLLDDFFRVFFLANDCCRGVLLVGKIVGKYAGWFISNDFLPPTK
jgi:hypothetical protein